MILGKRVLAVIPARGGSKGVPRKNIRALRGKPLLAWTIEQAKQSRLIDRCILSSDDPEIIDIAQKWGCEAPFRRPAELAQDDTPGVDPVLHALREVPGYDYVILLQVTSPLRTPGDIDGAIEMAVRGEALTLVSVSPVAKPPEWTFRIHAGHRLRRLEGGPPEMTRLQRQALAPAFSLNGAIFFSQCDFLARHRTFLDADTLAYEMPAERSLDIDSPVDFALAEILLGKGKA